MSPMSEWKAEDNTAKQDVEVNSSNSSDLKKILSDPQNLPPYVLHRFVWENDPESLDAVLEMAKDITFDTDVHGHTPFIDRQYRGMTALHLACQLGYEKCIQVLLNHWADTLIPSELGYFPLQEANSLGDRRIMEIILLRRHDQIRQLWKMRQPILAMAVQHDLPNFFLEMDWHFTSWIPFVSNLCPSDVYRVWKSGNRIRVDSTLMGLEVDALNWVRGNVSFIFEVNEIHSRLYILDHDRKIFQSIDRTGDFTPEEIEKDLNYRLNTQIYSGKVHRCATEGEDAKILFRPKQGMFGFGGDREEQIGAYMTKVYEMAEMEVVAKYRKEHLEARKSMAKEKEKAEAKEVTPQNEDEISIEKLKISETIDSIDSLESAKILEELGVDEPPKITGLIKNASKTDYEFTPSLPRPANIPTISEETFFDPNLADSYCHVGRPVVQSEKTRRIRPNIWMASNFPLTIQQLNPFIELMTMGNKNFARLQEIINMDLPPGFPVRIEIPLFAFLSAQVTFGHFISWDRTTTSVTLQQPAFALPEDGFDGWFKVPKSYEPGIVMDSLLKD